MGADSQFVIAKGVSSLLKLTVDTGKPPDLVALGEKNGTPVLDDLGSGAMLDTTKFGLGHEPMVQESLQAGASLVKPTILKLE